MATLQLHLSFKPSYGIRGCSPQWFHLWYSKLSTLSSALSPSLVNHFSTSPAKSDHWPSIFPVPLFSYDDELRLKKGNEDLQEKGPTLIVPRDRIWNKYPGKIVWNCVLLQSLPQRLGKDPNRHGSICFNRKTPMSKTEGRTMDRNRGKPAWSFRCSTTVRNSP